MDSKYVCEQRDSLTNGKYYNSKAYWQMNFIMKAIFIKIIKRVIENLK